MKNRVFKGIKLYQFAFMALLVLGLSIMLYIGTHIEEQEFSEAGGSIKAAQGIMVGSFLFLSLACTAIMTFGLREELFMGLILLALMIGYSIATPVGNVPDEPAHFSRAFKQVTGVPPQQYGKERS